MKTKPVSNQLFSKKNHVLNAIAFIVVENTGLL